MVAGTSLLQGQSEERHGRPEKGSGDGESLPASFSLVIPGFFSTVGCTQGST